MVQRHARGENAISWLARIRQEFGRKYRRYMEDREETRSSRATDRVVRDFEWGLDWTAKWPSANSGHSGDPAHYLDLLSTAAVRESRVFYGYEKPSDFHLSDDRLTFTSAAPSPYATHNVVHAQWFPAS